jgi:cytochrome b561
MKKDSKDALSLISILLHWLVAIGMISLLTVGIYMSQTETYFLYPWHKSFGFILFFIILARVIWRLTQGWPTPVQKFERYEQVISKITHWVLIIGTLIMPISGILMSSLSGHGLKVFGASIIPFNPDPSAPNKALAHNETLAAFFHTTHGWVGYLLVVFILLHILGACKHHFINKDRTLKRMLGSKEIDGYKGQTRSK